jgi:hypothetical protein
MTAHQRQPFPLKYSIGLPLAENFCITGRGTKQRRFEIMMAGIFLLQAIAIGVAWRGDRGPAAGLALGSIVLAALLFSHHASDELGLSF